MNENDKKRIFQLRKMKKQFACLLAASLITASPIYAGEQTQKISLKKSNASIESILKDIESQSGYSCFYSDNNVNLNSKISINMDNASVEDVLNNIFKSSGYQYQIVESQIVITKKEINEVASVTQQRQQVIKGIVKDQFGEPLIGASVVEKGVQGNGTVTNLDGEFTLDVTTNTVIVSYIGYLPYELKVTPGISQYNVILKEDVKSLDEVIVVGYSTQRKESLTGSLQSIKSDKLKDVTSPSVENMLNGKIPGVYVAPGSGQPGAAGAVVIRGQATLSGTTSPLWVVDGVIVGSSAGQLNPEDIESITVLKDAASTAIYGSQGANGVIVVTTKNPKAEKMTVNLSAKVGASQLNTGNLEMMNGAELYDYYSSYANADEIQFPRWNSDLRNSNFNWWDLATKTGFTQDYNISITGGSENLQAYLSLGYYDEEGAVKGYDYSRYSFRMKTVYKPLKWLTLRPAVAGSRRDIKDAQYSVTSMYSMLPWDSPYDENGDLVPHRYSGWVNNASTNYLYDLQWNHSSSRNFDFSGNMDFDIKIFDWLTFASVNNYKVINYTSSGYTDPRSNGGSGVNGRISEYMSEVVRRYTNQMLRFNKSFGKHALNGLVAYEFNDYWGKTVSTAGTGFIPGFEILDVTTKPEVASGGISEWAVQSVLFNANYAYDNRYLAQFSFRRDGASNFGDNEKYGNFFSISAGWNITNESWFKADWVDVLKVRASYGSVGNRPSSLYPQYDLYSVSSGYNEESGALISQIGNKDLTWEKTYTTGVGLDAAFFNNRLRFNFDYYIKKTDNILYAVPVTGLIGVTSIWKNIGEMKNKGIEISLGGDIISTKDLTWSVDVNLGHNSNKLEALYKTKDTDGSYVVKPVIISDGSGIAGTAQRILDPGYAVDTYYLKEWAGVNPENGAPMWYVVETDANGNETSRTTTSNYSSATYQKCGVASPKIFGGFSTNLMWKNLDFGAVFGYSVGGQIYNYSRQEYDADGTYSDRNQMKLHKGWSRWEKPGDVATHPIAKYNNQDKGNSASSRYLEKSDFLKLRSLTLGYNFKLSQYHINNLRVYFTGENLFTVTDYSGVDPEIPASSGSVMGTAGPAVYPSTRKYMFGVNLTF